MTPNWKPEKIIDKVRRHIKRRKTVGDEQKIMREVRREDRYCRFPMCSCGRLKLALDVCHLQHRGSGGNPKLDRTTPENLITLCRPRHRAHKFSLDKKTLRAVPLTADGLRGPVRWLIDFQLLRLHTHPMDGKPPDFWDEVRSDKPRLADWPWYPLAEETARHSFLPFTSAQREILTLLAGMEC